MHFHDLRHSAATILLAMGVHPKVVQELLGHSNISITMNLYSHVLPSMQRDAMHEMNNFLTGGDGQQRVRRQRVTKSKARSKMNNDEKHAALKRIEALTHDSVHIRKNALRLSGLYLQDAEEKIIEQELNKLDDEILEDEQIYTAHKALIEGIVREVMKIGDELIRQSRLLDTGETN